MKKTKLNPVETTNLLKHIIENNAHLQSIGEIPLALNIEGRAGIGKTSVVEQAALSLGMKAENFVVLNLSQFEEIGDLVGSPIKQFQVGLKKEEGGFKAKWVYEKEVDEHLKNGYVILNSRMSYAKPEWITGKSEFGILFLDDYSRASSRFMQATMELINKQAYSSWGLPKGWTIVLSTNPEGGDYSVTDLDPAQKSRYLTVEMVTSKDAWIDWAYTIGLDERVIAFVALNPEVLNPVKNKEEINPRSLHNFFKSIASIKDYEKNLALVQMLGESSIGPEITSNFTSFIHNKLDKLPSTEYIFDLQNRDDEVIDAIKKVVITDTNAYRADIAAVISRRIINFLLNENEGSSQPYINRVESLIKSDCLGNDLKFVIAQKLVQDPANRFKSLTTNKDIVNIILD